MKTPQIILLICGVLVFSLAAPMPVRAQAENPCASLNAPKVNASDILACLRLGQSIEIENAKIVGDLDLTTLSEKSNNSVIVPARIWISDSQFTGSVIAMDGDRKVNVIFKDWVKFSGSHFDQDVDFSNAHFEEFVEFGSAEFAGSANFVQVSFMQGVDFTSATFNEHASFFDAIFSGGPDFSEAQFHAGVDFTKSHFTEGADIWFIETHFWGNSYFDEAEFGAPVTFYKAEFKRKTDQDIVSFSNSKFTLIDLTDALFESGQLELRNSEYKLTMPNFDPAVLAPDNDQGVYTLLENNFVEQKQIGIANEIKYWAQSRAHEDLPPFVRPFDTILLDWTFGYGSKPLRAIAASIILILFFAIFYYPTDVLRPVVFAPSRPREQRFTIRLTELPITYDEENVETQGQNQTARQLPPQLLRAVRAIAFSFGVFTKLSSGKYVAIRGRFVVMTEWIIGWMMIAGFLFSLANTNPLLRSMLDFFK